MQKEKYNVKLGKLAPPSPDGLVKFRRLGLIPPEKASALAQECLAYERRTYKTDDLYFAAENKKKRRRI